MINTCLFGDCKESLQSIKNNGITIQTCVTSPPYYGLRSYLDKDDEDKHLEIGLEQTPEEYINNLVNVFRNVKDILADDGTLWINISDSYYNYRPGKGQRQSKQSICSQKYSEVDECGKRGNKLEGYKEKDLIGIPWMLAFALRADGWWLRQDIIWAKGTSGLRREGNILPESVKDRCSKSHEYIFLLSKSKNYYFDHKAIQEPAKDWGTRDRSNFRNGTTDPLLKHHGLNTSPDMGNRRSVWRVNPKPYKGSHFAVYPSELIEPCILAGSREGDIVLDPFLGSGTTAMVAEKLKRNWIGCELNTEYKQLQDERLGLTGLHNFFED